MNERPDPNEPDDEATAPPEDAPVETPEADPRTEHAPDGGEPRSVDGNGGEEGED
jgi:hypothetical protein